MIDNSSISNSDSMKASITTFSFTVVVNDGPSFFRASRGLGQHDFLSPLLFIIVMEALHRLLEKARDIGDVVVGSGDHPVEVMHLFFTDITLIFYQSDKRMISNLRCIFLCFQAISRLNINLNKLELVKLRDRGDGDRLVVALGVILQSCQSST